ncbi:DNA-directed RNA polymerase I subunit RPA43 [Zophobas morio]|uniref:DNA-directed RNA polymerase I subunit RPA43 n=1 Tax=Zophobas morio TaxID=2755281 RepID=UPI00308381BD
MKKEKLPKSFNLKDLEEQSENRNSCIYLQRIQDHLALHPYHLSDLNNSLNEILNTRVGKYCPRLEGILCGYKNVNFSSQNGYICDDSCFIHVDTEADYFLFKPATEKLLQGVVNKISKDHVGCLVHNIFNISLPKPKHSENWIGDSLSINDEVELKITSTDFDRKLPYIKGEIISIQNKFENEETSTVENLSLKNQKKSKQSTATLFTPSSIQTRVDEAAIQNFSVTVEDEKSAIREKLPSKNHKKCAKAKKTLFTSSTQADADPVQNELKDIQENFSVVTVKSNIKRKLDENNEQSDSPTKKKKTKK